MTTSAVLVGLMSGTSLDGISAAVVRFTEENRFDLLAWRQVSYSPSQRDRLAAALKGATPDEYCRLNFDLGQWLAEAAIGVIADAGVPRGDIAAIASHGQTVWHVPGHSTWQFGESAVIAERTGIDVISDFRVRDVAAGGQGAPLVPMADATLFSHATAWRTLQNLGGIGNVTVVPPGGDTSAVRAFDTGPGVVVIDAVTRAVSDRAYDEDGALARSGTPIDDAVAEALSHPYFSAPPPKSTGRELFTPAWISEFIASCRRKRPNASNGDLVASAVALTARSIGDAFNRFIPEPVTELLVSGGGAENPALVDAIAAAVPKNVKVQRFADVYFDGEAKEAVAFALLGWLFLQNKPGNVVTVTGAGGPRILGKLTPAR